MALDLADSWALSSPGGVQRLGRPSVQVCCVSNPKGLYDANWIYRQHSGCGELYAFGMFSFLICPGSRLTCRFQEITVFNLDFPSDSSSVKFRAVQWICTEILLALAALLNFLPRMYKRVTWIQLSLTAF